MALAEATLADALESLTPTTNPLSALLILAAAYGGYMEESASNGVAMADSTAASTAMAGAMAFPVPSTPAQAGTALAAGVSAFWATMVGAPAAAYPGATVVTPPPGLAALAATLAATLAANVGNGLVDCAAALAAAIHAASAGGAATFPGPVVSPIA